MCMPMNGNTMPQLIAFSMQLCVSETQTLLPSFSTDDHLGTAGGKTVPDVVVEELQLDPTVTLHNRLQLPLALKQSQNKRCLSRVRCG